MFELERHPDETNIRLKKGNMNLIILEAGLSPPAGRILIIRPKGEKNVDVVLNTWNPFMLIPGKYMDSMISQSKLILIYILLCSNKTIPVISDYM